MMGSSLRYFSPLVFRPQAGLPWGIENTLSTSLNAEILVINTSAEAIRSFLRRQEVRRFFRSRRQQRTWAACPAAI